MKTCAPELEALFASVGQHDIHDVTSDHGPKENGGDCAQKLLVLTPNRRLSRFILTHYGLYQSSKNIEAWPTLPCMSINSWYQSLWEEICFGSSHEMGQCLQINASQEVSIWLDMIRTHTEKHELFNPSAAASACRRAWHTLVQWQAKSDLSAVQRLASEPGASEAFLEWIEHYTIFCKQKKLIDSSSAINHLLTAIADSKAALPEKIVLFGFDDINPQLQRLCELAEQSGSSIEHYNIYREAQQLRTFVQIDIEGEISAAARWASNIIQSNPDASVGVVVPQLLSLRPKVERIFTEVFEPQYVLPEYSRHASGFNISAAMPLSSTPPVAAALLALKLNFHALEIEDLSKVLHSPFIGDFNEVHARALFDNALREASTKVRVSTLRQLAGKFGTTESKSANITEQYQAPLTKDFYNRLQNLHRSVRGVPKKQAPSEWGVLFAEQLTILGWPGSRPLDTLEFQQVEVWYKSLAELNSFDYIFPSLSLSQCLELLERVAFDTQFQAQTYDSSVQILGVFEAAGMVFDHLWVMNFDNESWPPPVNPSSLLPLAMQKREGMPMASIERELTLAKKLTERFKASAHNVVFSYCSVDGDKQLQASSLIDDVPSFYQSDMPETIENGYLQTIFNEGGLEAFVDSCGPRIVDPKLVRGGTQILKDQAACPFRAFAKHRLGAKPFEQAVTGLNAAERGVLIHGALEVIWKKLRYQKRLLELEEASLKTLIDDSIAASFESILGRSPDVNKTIGTRLKQLETERVHKLLRAWLELEKQRAPFTVIFSETKKNMKMAKLPVQIRYDRIDKLDDDSLFIIDYKTGRQEIRTWSGERPDEPQVPIYGVANREKVSGVAYGQINVEQVAYKGISESGDGVPGISSPELLGRLELPDTWQEILDHWHDVLESLAKEYIAGFAEVKPKHKTLTCRHCTLHSLCRIKEYIEVEDEEEDTSEEKRIGVTQ